MALESHVLESVDSSGKGLRVEFRWSSDRFAHHVDRLAPDGAQRWLESIEGTDQQAWPASPPVQQISVEARPAGDVGLMVGMAGRAHWSASVEPLAGGAVRFDVACRTGEPPERLGSRYRVVGAVADLPERVVGGLVNSFVDFDAATFLLTVRPQSADVAWPATLRWVYELRP